MGKRRKTYLEAAMDKGYSRRDFMKLGAMMTAFMGLESSMVAKVTKAMEKAPRIPIIWLHGQECTCCSESFIRSSHPLVADILLDLVSLDYTETLMAPSGYQAEKSLHDTMKNYHGNYLLTVEGSIPTKEQGVYCCIGGKTFENIVQEAADGAKAVIAWGSCASNGCVQSANPNPTGATPIHEIIKGKPIINVPGCPPIAEVMAGVVVHLLTFDRIPELDRLRRPKAFYSRRVHDTCYRRPNFDAGLFVESFDDENAKKGYCLYKMGCKGPVTYNACGVIKWNNGVSFPIQSGHPCIGCSEENFWDNGGFYKRLPNFPGFGIESNADKVGLGLGIATGVGVAAHAVVTNIRKRKLIADGECEQKDVE
ncbi:MAG: [Ni/Fe] hydrogenase small subunit [Marinilabiliales bacterium]|nr:MAG: [Ni/Fe] hydrogenase small subunit [Marinilabiliales bacterium]